MCGISKTRFNVRPFTVIKKIVKNCHFPGIMRGWGFQAVVATTSRSVEIERLISSILLVDVNSTSKRLFVSHPTRPVKLRLNKRSRQVLERTLTFGTLVWENEVGEAASESLDCNWLPMITLIDAGIYWVQQEASPGCISFQVSW